MDGFDGGSEKVKNGGGRGGSRPNGSGGGGDSGGGDVNEALRKCLKENKGDYEKCKPKIEALKSFPTTSSKKPITPLRLRSGSLTDVFHIRYKNLSKKWMGLMVDWRKSRTAEVAAMEEVVVAVEEEEEEEEVVT
ncbi:hypothetical protein L1887_41882 [Cichorium endivia]|nr:hypothetical protein L1887_41882 [Cichorium endivia]